MHVGIILETLLADLLGCCLEFLLTDVLASLSSVPVTIGHVQCPPIHHFDEAETM